MKQLSLAEREARVKPWDINDPHAIRIHQKIAEMMALDFQPYSIVSDTGFTELLKTFEPTYNLPSRRYFTEDVPGIANNINSKLAEVLKDVTHLSLTTDIWSTSLTNQSLISLTGHWIQDGFLRKSAVLHVKQLEGSHTGEKICESIESMIDYWKIPKEQIHLVLTDNASNMKKALRDANFSGFGCFAHSLQLVINDGVISQEVVIDVLAVARSIVGHFKRSTLAYHLLDEIREHLDIPKHKLQQDEPTRWNSTLFILDSIYEQKMALAAYATEHGGITMLNSHQLEIVQKLVSLLKPIEEVTKMISTNSTCISAVIPLVRILERMLTKHDDDDAGIRTMKSEMLTSLECRFNHIEQIEKLCVATILDPRFKHHFFTGTETQQLTRQYLIDNCGYITGVDEPPNKKPQHDNHLTAFGGNNQALSSKVWECFTELLEEAGATSDLGGGPEAMVDNYLSEPLIDYKQGDPLK